MDILLWAGSAILSLGLSFIISTIFLDVFLKWDYNDPGERVWVSLTLWGLLLSVLVVIFMGLFQPLIFKVII